MRRMKRTFVRSRFVVDEVVDGAKASLFLSCPALMPHITRSATI